MNAELLLELANRCEREEPSRELEVSIFKAAGTIDEGHCAAWCRQEGRTDLTRARYIAAWAPNYCKSLDAAVGLVPDGFGYNLDVGKNGYCGAEVARLDGRFLVEGDLERYGNARPAALALCAAALRARAAILGT